MVQIQWKINGGLHETEVRAIHEAALRMIDEVGIRVPSKEALRMLEGQPGVKIRSGTRVCVAPERVTELLGPFPRTIEETQEEPTFHVSGYALRCRDLRTGEIRRSTTQDMIEFTKIGHALGVRGNTTVMPQDMNQKLAEIATYKLCLTYRTEYGAQGSSAMTGYTIWCRKSRSSSAADIPSGCI